VSMRWTRFLNKLSVNSKIFFQDTPQTWNGSSISLLLLEKSWQKSMLTYSSFRKNLKSMRNRF
jgi:hypothetical protein